MKAVLITPAPCVFWMRALTIASLPCTMRREMFHCPSTRCLTTCTIAMLGQEISCGRPNFPLRRGKAVRKALRKVDVACQTIYCQQQGATERQVPDFIGQNLDQIQIPVRANHTTQPQTGRYHDR